MLETEREFYSEKLADWLNQYPGKFVLIKEKEMVGAFDTEDEAVAEGARRFGLQPYLVRRIQKQKQTEVTAPALTLGILRANSTLPA
jgi:hypothetical protein